MKKSIQRWADVVGGFALSPEILSSIVIPEELFQIQKKLEEINDKFFKEGKITKKFPVEIIIHGGWVRDKVFGMIHREELLEPLIPYDEDYAFTVPKEFMDELVAQGFYNLKAGKSNQVFYLKLLNKKLEISTIGNIKNPNSVESIMLESSITRGIKSDAMMLRVDSSSKKVSPQVYDFHNAYDAIKKKRIEIIDDFFNNLEKNNTKEWQTRKKIIKFVFRSLGYQARLTQHFPKDKSPTSEEKLVSEISKVASNFHQYIDNGNLTEQMYKNFSRGYAEQFLTLVEPFKIFNIIFSDYTELKKQYFLMANKIDAIRDKESLTREKVFSIIFLVSLFFDYKSGKRSYNKVINDFFKNQYMKISPMQIGRVKIILSQFETENYNKPFEIFLENAITTIVAFELKHNNNDTKIFNSGFILNNKTSDNPGHVASEDVKAKANTEHPTVKNRTPNIYEIRQIIKKSMERASEENSDGSSSEDETAVPNISQKKFQHESKDNYKKPKRRPNNFFENSKKPDDELDAELELLNTSSKWNFSFNIFRAAKKPEKSKGLTASKKLPERIKNQILSEQRQRTAQNDNSGVTPSTVPVKKPKPLFINRAQKKLFEKYDDEMKELLKKRESQYATSQSFWTITEFEENPNNRIYPQWLSYFHFYYFMMSLIGVSPGIAVSLFARMFLWNFIETGSRQLLGDAIFDSIKFLDVGIITGTFLTIYSIFAKKDNDAAHEAEMKHNREIGKMWEKVEKVIREAEAKAAEKQKRLAEKVAPENMESPSPKSPGQ